MGPLPRSGVRPCGLSADPDAVELGGHVAHPPYHGGPTESSGNSLAVPPSAGSCGGGNRKSNCGISGHPGQPPHPPGAVNTVADTSGGVRKQRPTAARPPRTNRARRLPKHGVAAELLPLTTLVHEVPSHIPQPASRSTPRLRRITLHTFERERHSVRAPLSPCRNPKPHRLQGHVSAQLSRSEGLWLRGQDPAQWRNRLQELSACSKVPRGPG